MVEINEIAYGGWSRCLQMTNGVIDLVITAEVGPRIIRLGFVGQDNEFREDADAMGKTGGDAWRAYGGHRLWHAPENRPRTYYPDNAPVEFAALEHVLRVTPPVETTTGIAKQMDITLSEEGGHVRIIHRLTNTGVWPVECAVWALSVMALGGRAVVPLPPRGSHTDNLLPTSTLALWAYTNMSDPRWTWGEQYILLQQADAPPQKIGVNMQDDWAAYVRDGHMFLKFFTVKQGATYPDYNSQVEVFTNAVMLELETLGPLQTLQPGDSLEHIEDWFLFDGVATPANDADVQSQIVPKVNDARARLG
ncbi:MAG: hypothetical protein OHK0046_37450 [Anaerolineae bacterium]